jgi:hypothetical protein
MSIIVYRIYGKLYREKYSKKIIFNFAKMKFVTWQVFSILKRQSVNVPLMDPYRFNVLKTF